MRGKAPTVFPLFHSLNILIIFLDNQVETVTGALRGHLEASSSQDLHVHNCHVSLILHLWKTHIADRRVRAAIPRSLRFCPTLCWVLSLYPEKVTRLGVKRPSPTSTLPLALSLQY
jgi:hypothetical protein